MEPAASFEIKENSVVELTLAFDEAQVRSFAQLSGDLNPLHLDAAFARKRGFSGCVVHGALIVAAISRLLGMKLPGPGCVWHSFSLQFKAPLYAGETARLVGRVTYVQPEMRLCRLDIEVLRDRQLIAKGQAQAQLPLAEG